MSEMAISEPMYGVGKEGSVSTYLHMTMCVCVNVLSVGLSVCLSVCLRLCSKCNQSVLCSYLRHGLLCCDVYTCASHVHDCLCILLCHMTITREMSNESTVQYRQDNTRPIKRQIGLLHHKQPTSDWE